MEALEFFDLQKHSSRTVRELSLGQRRRAVFAAAFIGKPQHILLDDPLDGVGRKIKDYIIVWIRHYVELGAVVIVVSHTIEPFVELASQAVTIKDGSAVLYPNIPIDSEKRFVLLEDLAKGIV